MGTIWGPVGLLTAEAGTLAADWTAVASAGLAATELVLLTPLVAAAAPKGAGVDAATIPCVRAVD